MTSMVFELFSNILFLSDALIVATVSAVLLRDCLFKSDEIMASFS